MTATLQRNAGAARRFARLLRFSDWLQKLPNKLTPPSFRLIQIGSAFWQSRALYVAAKLDIATALADGESDAGELAAKVGADADALFRLLRMLAAMGVFEECGPRRFRNNRLSQNLREDRPCCVRAMVLMHNHEAMSRPWFEKLEQGVREGRTPFELAHGDELYPYMDRHADFDALFSRAMESVEALAGDAFATDFDWGRFHRLIDLGGGNGTKSAAILRRHSGLKALVVDRPQVVAAAKAAWAAGKDEIGKRMSFQPGDLLEAVPPTEGEGDIYLLCAVLHGMSDAECLRLLRSLQPAAEQGARVAVMEMVVPAQNADFASASFDMQMFMGTKGRERTLEEWRNLAQGGGLRLEEVVELRSFWKVLVLGNAVRG